MRRICSTGGCSAPIASRDKCADCWDRVSKPLSAAKLVSLRRMLGLPDGGPSREMHREWSRIEYLIEQRDLQAPPGRGVAA